MKIKFPQNKIGVWYAAIVGNVYSHPGLYLSITNRNGTMRYGNGKTHLNLVNVVALTFFNQ